MQKLVGLAVAVGLLAAWGIVPDAQAQWACQGKLTDPLEGSDSGNPAYFGLDVDIYGDRCIVGGTRADAIEVDAGAACVFRRANKIWTFEARLTNSQGQGWINGVDIPPYPDGFGWYVAMGADRAVVGGPYAYRVAYGNKYVGSAVFFSRSGTNWSADTNMFGRVNYDDNLGHEAAMSADGTWAYLGTGTDLDDLKVYQRSGPTWSLYTNLTEASAQGNYARWTAEMSRDGTQILCSDRRDNDTGTIYIYRLSGGTWVDDGTLPYWGL